MRAPREGFRPERGETARLFAWLDLVAHGSFVCYGAEARPRRSRGHARTRPGSCRRFTVPGRRDTFEKAIKDELICQRGRLTGRAPGSRDAPEPRGPARAAGAAADPGRAATGPATGCPASSRWPPASGVAHPTLREALRKLETLGLVDIRHGSGVYVGVDDDPLLVPNPIFEGRRPPRAAAGPGAGAHPHRGEGRGAGRGGRHRGAAGADAGHARRGGGAAGRRRRRARGRPRLPPRDRAGLRKPGAPPDPGGAGGARSCEEQRFTDDTHASRRGFHREHLGTPGCPGAPGAGAGGGADAGAPGGRAGRAAAEGLTGTFPTQ